MPMPAAAAMREEVFQVFEFSHVHLHLEVAPARVLPRVALREAIVAALKRQPRVGCTGHLVQQ